MTTQKTIRLPEFKKGFHTITDRIAAALPQLPDSGVLHLFLQHTSAALAINENADPSVVRDMNMAFDRIAPTTFPYSHTAEGPDDMPAHVKSVLTSCSVIIPITHGKMNLGTWQGIYLCEFRERGGSRTLIASVLS